MTCTSSTNGIPPGTPQDLQGVCDEGNTTTTAIDMNSAGATLTVGSGAGAPAIILDQSADEQGTLQIQNASVARGSFYFGQGDPAVAATNGDIYFDMENTTDSMWKYVGGAWAKVVPGAAGPTTHEMFFMGNGGGTPYGDYNTTQLWAGGGDEQFTFSIPSDFSSLVSLHAILIPGATDGTWDIDLDSDYGAIGEQYDNHSQADNATTYALTLGQLYALDLSPVFTNIAAGDFCGVTITNNDGSDDLYVIGIRLIYNY